MPTRDWRSLTIRLLQLGVTIDERETCSAFCSIWCSSYMIPEYKAQGGTCDSAFADDIPACSDKGFDVTKALEKAKKYEGDPDPVRKRSCYCVDEDAEFCKLREEKNGKRTTCDAECDKECPEKGYTSSSGCYSDENVPHSHQGAPVCKE
eukprot:TRINITY_DN27456_c0_g1_i2.p1 TRINITY_DN27456_c0_g1~~TRINITY_DN27456_c0_g1_i2.p1  ORF type:complete len:150 (-),score=2.55 TRINITY_DN27456_c0_g1_i2:109-558(-)